MYVLGSCRRIALELAALVFATAACGGESTDLSGSTVPLPIESDFVGMPATHVDLPSWWLPPATRGQRDRTEDPGSSPSPSAQTREPIVYTLGADLLFEVGSATPQAGGVEALREVVASLKSTPEATVVVHGHTDAEGTPAYNLELSQRRNAAVKQLLVDAGIPTDRVTVVAWGESSPIATNETETGRRQNRRVEVVIEGAG